MEKPFREFHIFSPSYHIEALFSRNVAFLLYKKLASFREIPHRFRFLKQYSFSRKKHKKFAKHRRIIFRNLAFFRESIFSLQKWKPSEELVVLKVQAMKARRDRTRGRKRHVCLSVPKECACVIRN